MARMMSGWKPSSATCCASSLEAVPNRSQVRISRVVGHASTVDDRTRPLRFRRRRRSGLSGTDRGCRGDHGLDLDLDLPRRVHERLDHDGGVGRTDVVEVARRGPGSRPRSRRCRRGRRVRPHDVGEGRTRRLERIADDLEAPPGLDLGVGIDAVVRPLRGRAGHEDPLRDAHRSAVADDELPRPTRRDQLPVRHGEATYRAGQRARERVAGARSLSYGAAGGRPLASVSLDHDRGKRHGPATQGRTVRARDAERPSASWPRRAEAVVAGHRPARHRARRRRPWPHEAAQAPSGSTGGGTEAPTTAAAATPTPGGSLVFGIEADTSSPWRPAEMVCAISCHQVARTVYDSLMLTGRRPAAPIPGLKGRGECRLHCLEHHCPQGVTFHDGTPFDGAAIVDNLNRHKVGLLTGVAMKSVVTDISLSPHQPDDRSRHGRSLWATFPFYLTGQIGYMASPTWLAADADETLPSPPRRNRPVRVRGLQGQRILQGQAEPGLLEQAVPVLRPASSSSRSPTPSSAAMP